MSERLVHDYAFGGTRHRLTVVAAHGAYFVKSVVTVDGVENGQSMPIAEYPEDVDVMRIGICHLTDVLADRQAVLDRWRSELSSR